MQTKTLVQASAQVITITTLTPGDVYKRLVESWGGKFEAVYGVVQTVDFNGEDAMVTALELKGPVITTEVFGSGTDLRIFTSTPEEVQFAFDGAKDTLENAHQVKREELAKAHRSLLNLDVVRRQILDQKIQSPGVIATAAIDAIES